MSDKKQLSPMQSKKFLAFVLADLGWKAIILYQLMHLQGQLKTTELTFLITVVLTAGVIQIGYILGQAALDKYLHSAVEIFDKDDDTPKKEG
jgi:hypothetical protein